MQMRAPHVVAGLAVVVWANAFSTTLACPCSEIAKPLAVAPQMDRLAGIKFMDTEEYKKDFNSAVENARQACEKYKGQPNVAVVADIDETTLNNRPEFEAHPNFKWPQFNQWIEQSAAEPLKPTSDFLAWARQEGFAIFLLTGRTESQRRATIENLVKRGIAYDGLYMRPNGDESPAEVLKTAYRKQIEDTGFKVVVNIGDQLSDLYGGHSIDCEKLPNKIYYIP
jgi:predicted secreted acid phosphatase